MPNNIKKLLSKYHIDVSRETLDQLDIYNKLLLKWQKTINLVSATTLDELELRHFIDSAQLIKYIADKDIVMADMGSGAGFPGLVLAILGVKEVHLIESDIRKSTFLREVSRETSLSNITIHDDRIEDVKIDNIDLITARALASLKDLLTMSQSLATAGHNYYCLFLKGEKHEDDIKRARKFWNFELNTHQSITDESGKILEISNVIKINK